MPDSCAVCGREKGDWMQGDSRVCAVASVPARETALMLLHTTGCLRLGYESAVEERDAARAALAEAARLRDAWSKAYWTTLESWQKLGDSVREAIAKRMLPPIPDLDTLTAAPPPVPHG